MRPSTTVAVAPMSWARILPTNEIHAERTLSFFFAFFLAWSSPGSGAGRLIRTSLVPSGRRSVTHSSRPGGWQGVCHRVWPSSTAFRPARLARGFMLCKELRAFLTRSYCARRGVAGPFDTRWKKWQRRRRVAPGVRDGTERVPARGLSALFEHPFRSLPIQEPEVEAGNPVGSLADFSDLRARREAAARLLHEDRVALHEAQRGHDPGPALADVVGHG